MVDVIASCVKVPVLGSNDVMRTGAPPALAPAIGIR